MPSIDSFDASVTKIEYPWPAGISGLERIMLSATGDLQRLLCAFFDRPITISRVHAETSPYTLAPISPVPSSSKSTCDEIFALMARTTPIPPITQSRQVHLLCSGRVVCEATSTVTITSRECAELFLEERYAIGQLFRKMRTVPQFELVDVGIEVDGVDSEKETKYVRKGRKDVSLTSKTFRPEKLWRRYTLKMQGFECDILEVFPDRRIFTMGTAWLDSNHTRVKPIPPRLIIEDEDGKIKDTVAVSSCEDSDEQSNLNDASWRDNISGRMRLLVAFLAILYLLIRGEANFKPSGWSYGSESLGESST